MRLPPNACECICRKHWIDAWCKSAPARYRASSQERDSRIAQLTMPTML